MTLLDRTCASVVPADAGAAAAAQRRLDNKTKPRRSLGRLEDLTCQLAAIYRTADPPLSAKAVVVMAADHGVAEEGVSAYPQEVTGQMLANFAAGGAAINVLARQQDARVVVVDMGTKSEIRNPKSEIRRRRLGPGTANFSSSPAMSRETARLAVETGIQIANELIAERIGLIAVGDMGIANTSSASALTAALTGAAVVQVTGRGTGIDDGRFERKVQIIQQALARHQPASNDPLNALAAVGGFEIGGLAGVILGSAAGKIPVLLDGFITGAAALVAVRLCSAVRDYLIASHQSIEPGHRVQLRSLGLKPLLDLEMRLGEGTGAVLAMNLVEASLRILREMATFEAAQVTDTGA
jgi:nicotinate-nucleotide--dimethylbenzimidazole phosphoribosyltransferase